MNEILKSTVMEEIAVLEPFRPQVPGLSLRGFRGEEDYPAILAILTGSVKADGIVRSETLERITSNYAHLHNCDPYQDMLFAEIDGKPVGYCRCMWDIDGENQWIGSQVAFLLPEARRIGIGTFFLRFIERRLAETASQLKSEGLLPAEATCWLNGDASQEETGKHALFQKNGYQPARYGFLMRRPDLENIPDAPLPDGLEVRTARPEFYRAVWEASQEAFQDHWGYIRQPDEEYEKWLEDPYFDPSLWRVAWDGDQVAGMVLSFINTQENAEYNRKRGYTENISVRRPWRRRGLARALLVQSLYALKERGMTEAGLGVDSQNLSGALQLYQSVGFAIENQTTLYRKKIEI